MFERELEFTAPKAKTATEKLILGAMWLVIIALVAIIMVKVSWIGGICAMLIVVPLYLNKRFTKEYSYVLAGDKLTVSVADFKGNKTPVGKNVFLEDLVVCARESDPRFGEAMAQKCPNYIDARTSAGSKTAAFALFDRDGEKSLVRFEPSDMMISEMKKYAGEKVSL